MQAVNKINAQEAYLVSGSMMIARVHLHDDSSIFGGVCSSVWPTINRVVP